MKTLKQILEVYSPKSADEKRFVKKHITVKTADVAGNGDDVYSGAKIKEIDRKATRKGYNTADSEAVYEDASPPKHYGGKGVQGAKFDAYMAQRKRELEKSRPTTAKEEVEQINEIGDTPAGRKLLKKVDKRAFYMGGTKKGGKANMADAGEKTLQRTAARLKKEEIEQMDEVLKVSSGAGEWIKDFESSKNPKFAGKSKEQRKQQALAAYYSAKRAGKE